MPAAALAFAKPLAIAVAVPSTRREPITHAQPDADRHVVRATRVISVAHAVCAVIAAVALWRALAQSWVGDITTDPIARGLIAWGIPITSAAASAFAVAAGRLADRPLRLFRLDAISFACLLIVAFALTTGRLDSATIALLVVVGALIRLTAPLVGLMTPMSRSRVRLDWRVFLAVSALALLLTIVTVYQPWADGEDPVAVWFARQWLPFGLAVATALGAIVGQSLPPNQRTGFFARQLAVFAVVPLVILVMRGFPYTEHLLGALYLAFAVGLAINALHAIWTLADALSDRRAAVLIGATMLAVGLVVLPYDAGVAPTASDEPHYLVIVQSITLDGDLDLANDYDGERYLAFYPERLPHGHGIQVGEAIYPIRDLALPVLGAVPFAIAGRTGTLALICLMGALLAAQLYLLLRDLDFARRIALLAVALTVFVHPFLTYTTQIYPDLIAALVFVSVVRLVRRGTATSINELALASALTGTLPWLTTRSYFLVIGLGLVIAYCALWPRRDLLGRTAAGALPFAALVVFLSYVNWRMFGLFMPSAGYFLLRDQQEVVTFAPHVGLVGLFFDRAFGLIPRAPVYLLAFLGLSALWQRRRSHGVSLWALALPFLLHLGFIASIAYWYADGGPPSRYLLAALPALVVGVAAGLEIVRTTLGRLGTVLTAFVAVAAWWSVFVTFIYAVKPGVRYEYMPQIRGGDAIELWAEIGKVLRPDIQRAFPSIYAGEPLTAVLAFGWVLIALGFVAFGMRRPDRVRSPA